MGAGHWLSYFWRCCTICSDEITQDCYTILSQKHVSLCVLHNVHLTTPHPFPPVFQSRNSCITSGYIRNTECRFWSNYWNFSRTQSSRKKASNTGQSRGSKCGKKMFIDCIQQSLRQPFRGGIISSWEILELSRNDKCNIWKISQIIFCGLFYDTPTCLAYPTYHYRSTGKVSLKDIFRLKESGRNCSLWVTWCCTN